MYNIVLNSSFFFPEGIRNKSKVSFATVFQPPAGCEIEKPQHGHPLRGSFPLVDPLRQSLRTHPNNVIYLHHDVKTLPDKP